MATSLDLARTYTSYSGVDIRVIINGAQVGSMQALSYAIQREKAPIYVMGSVDPISYSRGKRGIAGTMISLMMDTHILMSESFKNEKYLGDTDEIFPSMRAKNADANATNPPSPGSTLTNISGNASDPVNLEQLGGGKVGATFKDDGNAVTSYGTTTRNEGTYNLENIGTNYTIAPVFYVDQILPFDISIVAANEYGQSAQMRLYGCEILNEGSGFSIDDIVIENQMTYVCRTILPWRSFEMQTKTVGGAGTVSPREGLYTNASNATVNIRGGKPVYNG